MSDPIYRFARGGVPRVAGGERPSLYDPDTASTAVVILTALSIVVLAATLFIFIARKYSRDAVGRSSTKALPRQWEYAQFLRVGFSLVFGLLVACQMLTAKYM